MKRQRGRNRRNNNSNQGNANRSMESNGPDVKVRGTAKQIFEKYEALAADAASSGNRVKAENCRQHAEHYLRIVNAVEASKQVAKEETDAERNDQSDSDSKEESGSNEKVDEGKPRRRYPPQVKRSSKPEDKTSSDDEAVKGLEVVEPKSSEGDSDVGTDDAPKKVTRRRKAPTRPEKNEESAPEAAE